MAEFIPVSDDFLYQNPEVYSALVPYQVGLPCTRLQRDPIALTPADLMVVAKPSDTGSSAASTATSTTTKGDKNDD